MDSLASRVCIGFIDERVNLNNLGSALYNIPAGVKVLENTGIFYSGDITIPNGTFNTGDIIGVLYDSITQKISFRKNNILIYEYSLTVSLNWKLATMVSLSKDICTANFGATPFKYPIPEGYLPCDMESANWFNPKKYLLKQDSKILTIESNILTETALQEPLTKAGFEER